MIKEFENPRDNCKVPKALFNSKALFNPYQYLPFEKVMKWNEDTKQYMLNEKNILITDEVGVGKTFEVGIILRELLCMDPNLSVLILCPVKLCESWENELSENFGIGAINYHKRKVMGQISIVPYSFFSKNEKHEMSDAMKEERELIVLEETCDDKKLKELYSYNVLILDEAHYIRNKGKLWGYIKKIIDQYEDNETRLRIFLTGTPVFNTKKDYVNITELLVHKNQSFETTNTLQAEANCYDDILSIKFGGIKNNQPGELISANDIEQKIISEIYSRIEKENDEGEVIEVPKYGRYTGFLKRISSSSFYSLKQYVENKQYYEDDYYEYDYYEDDYYEYDYYEDDYLNTSDTLKVLVRQWTVEEDSKLVALNELLNYLHKKDECDNFKAIIFASFITTCNYLKEQLEANYHVYVITGQTNTKKVSEYKSAFEKDGKPSILICSDAAKEGHNLQFCHFLIHYDLPYTPAVIGQRNGRIYRRGQERKPEVFYLLMKSGYDKRLFGEIIVGKCQVIKGLEEKISILNILPGDADEYIEKCVNTFIEDYFSAVGKHVQSNNSNPQAEKNEKKIAEDFLMKYLGEICRKENNEIQIDWKSRKAKELFDRIKETNEEIDYKNEITNLYKALMRGCDNTVKLRDIYQEEYDKKLDRFSERCFNSIKQEDSQDARKHFIECCNHYTGITETKYCQHMMCNELEEGLTLQEYKKQFKPLKEWEENNEC